MTDNRTTELLPCPFCGGEAHTYKNSLWHVACERALHGCVTMSAFLTEAEAIAAWNTRATDALADYYRWKSAKGLTPEQHTQWNMELHRLLDGERQRIADLKQLVRDMYDVAARGEFDVGEESKFSERMAKLGVVYEC